MLSDPRRVLAAGFLGILCLGLVVRTFVGPVPAAGWRVNRALAAPPSEAAAATLERAARERPGDAGAWVRAGRARAALGDALAAAELIEVAVEIDPSSSTTRYELSKALASGWLNGEAEGVLERMLERRPGHADGLFLFAALAAARGDAAAAAARFDAAVAAGASDPARFREDPRFDPVRAEPRFLQAVRDRRFPSAFASESG